MLVVWSPEGEARFPGSLRKRSGRLRSSHRISWRALDTNTRSLSLRRHRPYHPGLGIEPDLSAARPSPEA